MWLTNLVNGEGFNQVIVRKCLRPGTVGCRFFPDKNQVNRINKLTTKVGQLLFDNNLKNFIRELLQEVLEIYNWILGQLGAVS